MISSSRPISSGVDYTLDELREIFKTNYSDRYSNSFENIPVYKNENNKLLPGEVFRAYPMNPNICYSDFVHYLGKLNKSDYRIYVSNLGRVKVNETIKTQYHTEYGYLKVNIIGDYYYSVYRLVAETWCKCPVNKTTRGWSVHHLNNNGFDNRPSNLIWVNAEEHGLIEANYKIQNDDIRNKIIKELNEYETSNNSQQRIKDLLEDLYLLLDMNKTPFNDYLSRFKLCASDFPNMLL